MSEPRDDAARDVYTMPSSAYRVGAVPEAPAQPAPERRPATPEQSAPSAGPHRRHRLWDIALSTVLLVGGAAAAGFGSVLALFLAFASDACSTACNYTQMDAGLWVAMLSPWVAWLAGVVVTIVLLVKRRIAFWVPFAGLAVGVLGWFLGAWLVGAAIG